jgi:hypothetical protein
MVAKLPKIKLDCWGRQSRYSGPRSLTKDPHTGFAADAVDIVAGGDVDLGEHGCVG